MRVKQLREFLERQPDDMVVVRIAPDHMYHRVNAISTGTAEYNECDRSLSEPPDLEEAKGGIFLQILVIE